MTKRPEKRVPKKHKKSIHVLRVLMGSKCVSSEPKPQNVVPNLSENTLRQNPLFSTQKHVGRPSRTPASLCDPSQQAKHVASACFSVRRWAVTEPSWHWASRLKLIKVAGGLGLKFEELGFEVEDGRRFGG